LQEEKTVNWCKEDTQKGGYDHFMIKEIHEQPRVIRDTILENDLADSKVTIGNGIQSLKIIACGTSYYAGLIGEYVIEELLVSRQPLFSDLNSIIVAQYSQMKQL